MFDVGTRILIVDDMFAMRKLISKIIKEIGFTDIKEADDGDKAWAAITEAKPPFGVVISDWNMPNCTGIDLLRRVRADSRFKNLPFLMITAEAEDHQVAEAVKAGVSNYIIKPFDAEMVKNKLEAMHKKIAG